jgi:hypothetical protein
MSNKMAERSGRTQAEKVAEYGVASGLGEVGLDPELEGVVLGLCPFAAAGVEPICAIEPHRIALAAAVES